MLKKTVFALIIIQIILLVILYFPSLEYYILLGIIQGFTEFIPVSSSGHLVLAQHFIKGFSQPGVFFDAFLHLGTLLAVIIYFRKKILSEMVSQCIHYCLGKI